MENAKAITRLDDMRHVAIYNPAQYDGKRVALIGVGTIGSNLAGILARMQVPMTLYDHDTVERHNLTTQTYGEKDIGKTKVAAVLEQLVAIQPEHPHLAVAEKFSIGEEKYDLVVSAVDSIEARKSIATEMIEKKLELPIVDARVGQEQVEVYYFQNPEAWLKQLPEEGDTDPCGARFTAYSAVVAAGFAANNVKRHLLGQAVQGRIIYDAATSTFIKE